MKNFSKKALVTIIFVILVLIFIVLAVIGFGKKDSSSSSNASSTIVINSKKVKLADCTSNSNTAVKKLSGWNTALYAAPLKNESSGSNISDNGVREFSISQVKAKTSPNSLYYRVEKEGGGNISGTKTIVEICNQDNKTKLYETTASTTTTPASADAIALITYLHGGVYYLEKPGTYRADAYLFTDGAWHLTDRINNIQLTE